MAQSIECCLHQREDLSSVPSTSVKSWTWQPSFVMVVLGNTDGGNPWRSAASTSCLITEFKAYERDSLQKHASGKKPE